MNKGSFWLSASCMKYRRREAICMLLVGILLFLPGLANALSVTESTDFGDSYDLTTEVGILDIGLNTVAGSLTRSTDMFDFFDASLIRGHTRVHEPAADARTDTDGRRRHLRDGRDALRAADGETALLSG